MKSKYVSPEEMEKNHIVRFSSLKPTGGGEKSEKGRIPQGAYEMLAARTAYVLTAPGDDNSPWDRAQVVTPGYVSIIAECLPGEGPSLHMHKKTVETFMVLTGKWQFEWGDEGEHSTILQPYDTFAIPAEVCRNFRNVSDEKAYVLVLISGGVHDMDDLSFTPQVGHAIEEKYGKDVREHAESIGFRFTAGVPGAD